MRRALLHVLCSVALLTGCAAPAPRVEDTHLQQNVRRPVIDDAAIPPLARPGIPPRLTPPSSPQPQERYTLVVRDVPVKALLFALARDAKIDVDLYPDLSGAVTLNAIAQPLPAILDRIAEQVDVRWRFENGVLKVEPDTPFVRTYTIDYPNLARTVSSSVAIATQIASTGRGGDTGTGNNSQTQITTAANNQFWQALLRGVSAIVGVQQPNGGATTTTSTPNAASIGQSGQTSPPGDAATPPSESATGAAPAAAATGSPALANPVVANPETGTLLVLATAKQHKQVQAYLDRILASARRQVLIEASVVEVELSDDYQQGVTWDLLHQKNSTFRFRTIPNGTSQSLPGGAPASGIVPSMGTIEFLRPFGSNLLDFSVQLLQSFGKTKVLSSPKLSVLNNQTAVLKVVESRVYFTLTAQYQPGSSGSPGTWTITSEPNTVPIGFLMAITPQISDSGEIILNLRPTVSRLIGYVEDPAVAVNLAIARGEFSSLPEVRSLVPEIQTREIESVIRVRDGEVAVLGGLMRDEIADGTDEVPGASRLPLVGELFRYRNNQSRKSELVIFLRPRIVTDPSIDTDYRDLARHLPGSDFFARDLPQRPLIPSVPER